MKDLFRIAVGYGFLGGLLGVVILTVLFWLNYHPFMIPPVYDFRIVLLSVLILFALRMFRDHYQDGVLFFWQAMIGSAVLVTVVALIGGLGVWIWSVVMPSFLSEYIRLLNDQMTLYQERIIQKVGEEAYAQQMAYLSHTSSLDLALDYFLKTHLIGLFMALIFSSILRKQTKKSKPAR